MEKTLNPKLPELNLYFIALLPPLEIRQDITQLKEYARDTYGSQAALKSPPHITLQPPFKLLEANIPLLKQRLTEFAGKTAPIEIELSGFAAFPPRVVFVDVVHTPGLMAVQPALTAYLKETLGIEDDRSRHRQFHPHVTIAFRDLQRHQFKKLWADVRDRSLYYPFTVFDLTLLQHDGRRWNVEAEFPLSAS
ncbi:MAG: 2'-5' RNA ligase family protein [Cyanobacteria bacterium SID2]|nr:2'-5' RNA ligase family protein [Cyanobacteria bacterium SID2]